MIQIFKKLPIDNVKKRSNVVKHLGAFDLTLVGLGAMVGSAIFSLTGVIAAAYCGPSVAICYVIAGLCSVLIAFPYAEVTSTFPTSGSIYSYAGAVVGDIGAWLALSILMMELASGAALASSCMATYCVTLFRDFGFIIPQKFLMTPLEGGIINVPSIIVTCILGGVSCMGSKGSKGMSNFFVYLKFFIIVAFVILIVPYFKVSNVKEFIPFGFDSALIGSAILFGAFAGFSVIPTMADECHNPSRDVVIGMLSSILITALIYFIVSFFIVGAVHYTNLGFPDISLKVMDACGYSALSQMVGAVIVFSISSVVIVLLNSKSKVFAVVSRDGMLPKWFSIVDKRGTPIFGLLFCIVLVSLIGGLTPYNQIAKVTSIGTSGEYLVMMVLACALRVKFSNVKRSFVCPALYVLSTTASMILLYMIVKQLLESLVVAKFVFGWITVWLGVYFAYLFSFRKV
ncbi:APC family permease [Candidatus Sneabacter namystus]|uniref:Amino acid permease n=1 Tax=Candidatus Sneabacter namystus TaxID=2601646 RepID=A0A5C0UIC1_9RICK|nr:amino acid permease [Candidatus Sneabacter namystus]QEK39490.1 amino acid permease [Candidatus Sneabacter namystus]